MKLSYKKITVDVPRGLMLWLRKRMKYVKAAGGVVVEESGLVLAIYRKGYWDLPKGHVEAGESLRQAALREVEEETGISCTIAPLPPMKTYHIYRLNKQWHLKQTSWFHMQSPATCPTLRLQVDEGIVRGQWERKVRWKERMLHSYGTLRNLARRWTF